MTPLDQAYAAMNDAPDDDALGLAFYGLLAESELFLLLTKETDGDQIEPELFDVSDAKFVLAFDREDRLGTFVGSPAPYAAVSGRALAQMLAGQGIGLGLNLEVAPSSTLLPANIMDWLVGTLPDAPAQTEARIDSIAPPAGLPETLLAILDRKLAQAGGLAHSAYLAEAKYDTGLRNHLLAFVDTVKGAEPAVAQSVSEALSFSGVDAGSLDVMFIAAHDPIAALLARNGLRFDLPVDAPQTLSPTAPGMNPENPPILK